MGRLNKRKKKILANLDKADNGSMDGIALQNILRDEPDNILPDIKLLEREEFVDNQYSLGSTFPTKLTITPLGKAKLKEGFKTRLLDSAHDNPWAVVAILVTIIFGLISLTLYSDNIKLQDQIKQENELQQIMPPTIYLTQKLMNESDGALKIIPTLYFKKNSDRLFTIISYEPNLKLNEIMIGKIGGGFPAKFKNEGITDGAELFPPFYATAISHYNFFNHRNVLTINYVIEIKDMDNQIIYRGNVTTEVNSSSTFRDSPLTFDWYKVSNSYKALR